MSEHGNKNGVQKNAAEPDSGNSPRAEPAEAELKRALEFAEKKLQIVGTVTRHDVLNQMTALVGYNELLEMMVEDPKQRSYLEKEKQAIDKIRRQFRFAKDYQMIGVEPPRWQLLKNVFHRAVEEVDLKGIRIVDQTGGASVQADPLFEKVFTNLFENALRHSSATSIQISVVRKDAEIVLVVEDDGKGIALEDKTKIFERGYGKGTGWGLFLAMEILMFNHMAIQETGEPGKGTRFEIRIPQDHFRLEGGEPEVP
ncbi:MAG: sensor histidine kinase [Methanomicrobiales archaeon HGW-Methanomicrobiales-1]|jgi:signal transduction histidine kinase|nr:MAG: sensor histidine kinase [Methanomicrobiales archaeon HGW-Methanomicrobiales-1]